EGDRGGSPRLLALGDPVFERPDRPDPSAPPAPDRGAAFAPLLGTRDEVQAIARLFDQPVLLLGSQASEQSLDRLAATGGLREFDILPLATHGTLDPRVAMRSALILAQDQLPDPLGRVLAHQEAYDGRLTAEQILQTWELDAELVTLSACQTGRPYGG